MMHVRFNEAWHDKVQQTTLQVKWSSICNELHIDGTPHQLFSSISFIVLNNIKCWLAWHGVKHKRNYLTKQFQWDRKHQTTIPVNPHMHIFGLVLFCPKHNFRVVKHSK